MGICQHSQSFETRNCKGFKNWTGFLKENCLHKTTNRKSLKCIKFCLNIYLKKTKDSTNSIYKEVCNSRGEIKVVHKYRRKFSLFQIIKHFKLQTTLKNIASLYCTPETNIIL